MKTPSANFGLIAISVVILGCFASAPLGAEPVKEAKVTRVINDVNLLPDQAAPRPAAINDDVREGTAVRTGVESRTELTFTDLTIARLGANTIFTVNEGTRNIELGSGAILLRVPKNSGGAKITTAAVTAAITGTTVMMQYDAKSYAKFIVLEGTACMALNSNPKDCVPVKAGQLLTVKVNPPPTSLPAPVDVDLEKLLETSALLSSDFEPLPSLDLIRPVMEEQNQAKSEDSVAQANAVKAGGGNVFNALSNLTAAIDQRTAAEASPSPSP